MRRPYIKFFISSTFLDMQVERDVIQQVFSELEQEYKEKGWIIEYVDLRWGISSLESVNNKTVEICLDELSRCQTLSPRPNFIVLLGERRGWIPLPEKISDSRYREILKKLSLKNQKILNRWYIIDENFTSEPIYELRPKNCYGDISLFEKDRPFLEKILKKYSNDLFGLSATEIEIKNGMKGDECEHVISYFRNLSRIPKEHEQKYGSGSFLETYHNNRLQRKLKHRIPSENQIMRNISFAEFGTQTFKKNLKAELKIKISALINREVDRATGSDSFQQEKVAHENNAREEAAKLIERKSELKELYNWIEEPGWKDPMLITAPSGTGKSAITAGVAASFLNNPDWNVIVIYCGLTTKSSTLKGFINYLSECLQNIIGKKDSYQISYFSSSGKLESWKMKSQLSAAAKKKNLLLIADGLDRLELGLANKHDLLDCFLHKKAQSGEDKSNESKLRVILTSINNIEWIRSAPFPNITLDGIKEPDKFIDYMLSSKGRKVTEEQKNLLKEIIPTCDSRPVYLSLLSSCLATRTSYDPPIKFPEELSDLVKFFFDSLKNKGFPKRILDLSLALIIKSEGGLRHSDMLYLLGMDEEIWDNVSKDSSHDLPLIIKEKRMIPAMLWSRIFSELKILLRTNQDRLIGETVDISHPSLAKSISKLLSNDLKIKSISLLKDYFENLIKKNDYLAIDRIIKIELNYDETFDFKLSNDQSCNALRILLSPSFFISRKIHFGYRLEDDADLILSWKPNATSAMNLQKDMNWIEDDEEEIIMRRILNFSDDSVTKCAIEEKFYYSDLLVNALRNETIANTEISYLDRMSKVVMTGATSLVGFSLRKSRFIAFDLLNHEKDLGSEITYEDSKYCIDFADGTYLCCSHFRETYLVDILIWNWIEGKPVIKIEMMSKACEWMSQEKTHEYLYFGNDQDGTFRLNLKDISVKRSQEIRFSGSTSIDSGNGTISSQGKTLWKIDKTCGNVTWFYCLELEDLFEKEKETYKTIGIPSNHASRIIRFYVNDFTNELYVFYQDGGGVKFNLANAKHGDIIFPCDINYTYSVNALWFNDGKSDELYGIHTAYSMDRGVLFDYQRQKKMVSKDADAFNSINSLSCNMDGSIICSSYGWRVGSYAMRKAILTKVSDVESKSCNTYKVDRSEIRIPFNFDLLSYTQISPNGKYLTFATSGEIGKWNENSRIGILALDNVWESSKCWKIQDSICKILFGKNSEHAYYLGGHWGTMEKASLYVVSNKGEIYRHFPSDMTTVDSDMCLTTSERYVCVWNKSLLRNEVELRIYDIPNLTEKKINIDIRHFYNEKSKPTVTVVCQQNTDLLIVSTGKYIYIIDPQNAGVTKTFKFDREAEIKATCPDSDKVWMIDKEKNLYLVDIENNLMTKIKENVAEVYPTQDGKYIFTVSDIYRFDAVRFNKKTRISYSRFDGTECEYAILKSGAGICKLTPKGLVVSDFNNELLYFTPTNNLMNAKT